MGRSGSSGRRVHRGELAVQEKDRRASDDRNKGGPESGDGCDRGTEVEAVCSLHGPAVLSPDAEKRGEHRDQEEGQTADEQDPACDREDVWIHRPHRVQIDTSKDATSGVRTAGWRRRWENASGCGLESIPIPRRGWASLSRVPASIDVRRCFVGGRRAGGGATGLR